MDDGRLDLLEQALVRHARGRRRMDPPPDFMGGFTAEVMRGVRAQADRRGDFWSAFSLVARRFVPAGALAATLSYGYAQMSERLLNQALLALSLHGGGSAYMFAALLR